MNAEESKVRLFVQELDKFKTLMTEAQGKKYYIEFESD
jgi:hypothetical protein